MKVASAAIFAITGSIASSIRPINFWLMLLSSMSQAPRCVNFQQKT